MIKVIIFDLDDTIYPEKIKNINLVKVKLMLERLAKKYKLVLLSNATKEIVERKLETMVAKKLFTLIVTRTYFINRKPFRNKFFNVLSKLNITPEDALVIGDKLYTDILGAKLTGIRSVYINLGRKKRLWIKPDFVINSIFDLEKLLSRLTKKKFN